MAEVLAVASGIAAVVTAALQSGIALHETVRSLQDYQNRLTNLGHQVHALVRVLSSLQQLIRDEGEAACPSLGFPLQQCSEACQSFKRVLDGFVGRNRGGLARFGDCMKLRFREGDIVSFTEMVAGYKATISIAIADANLRTTMATRTVLLTYKTEIDATTGHVQRHMDEIKSRLDSLRSRLDQDAITSQQADIDDAAQTTEKANTDLCLSFLYQCQADMSNAQIRVLADTTTTRGPRIPRQQPTAAPDSVSPGDVSFAGCATLLCAKRVMEVVSETITTIQAHEQQNDHDASDTQASTAGEPSNVQMERLQSELESARQMLRFCGEASSRATERVHELEDIRVGDRGQQFCISTVGDLFKVRRAWAGNDSLQVFGTYSSGEDFGQLLQAARAGQNGTEPEEEEKQDAGQDDDGGAEGSQICYQTTGGSNKTK